MPIPPEEISALAHESRPRRLRRHSSSAYSFHVAIGVTYCCGMFMAMFPLIYCPCASFPAWLAPLSLVGSALALGPSIVGLLVARTVVGLATYVFLLLAVPATCLYVL